MKKSIVFPFLFILLISCDQSDNGKFSLLIEAESFDETGGWIVDPQFVEQMGSPYLLAHGLGEAVENATTKLHFKNTGTYHVWARTMNWVPGKWKAPGRFKIKVDKHELDTELGTETGWNWQHAGEVTIEKQHVIIELKDLTGFDGRCDAIYFSTQNQAPPNNAKDLKFWRKQQLQESDQPIEVQEFDLVIVGGGIAGCAAAITAAEQGLNVGLIHDRPVLGGNASGEIRVHTLGITWYYDRILKLINTAHYPNGSPVAKKEDIKRLNNVKKYQNIHLFLNRRAYSANTTNDSITSVDARHTCKGDIMRFKAPYFVDCTGDGWIGYWAGAEYMYGREDSSKYHENWEKHGELWSPAKADNRVMGSSVLWRTEDVGKPVAFPEVPWTLEVAKNHAAINGEWYWEYTNNDLHQIEDAEQIRDHLLKAIYGSFYNAKQNSENANLQLQWVSFLVGKRESRRLVGDYVYTFGDVRDMKQFPDSVVKEKRAVDVHYQQILIDSTKPDFYSEALFYRIDHYYIPYRCLYSKNIKNLFMAGRCFSCSHIGLGGPRVMNTTGQMGAAVGYAASLCKKNNVYPREIYEKYLDELKQLIVQCSQQSDL